MATKKKTAPAAAESTGENEVLQKAAKAIGSALGTIAAKTGLAHPPAQAEKRGKLPPKNKKRLPRKEKKALAAKKAQAVKKAAAKKTTARKR